MLDCIDLKICEEYNLYLVDIKEHKIFFGIEINDYFSAIKSINLSFLILILKWRALSRLGRGSVLELHTYYILLDRSLVGNDR